MRRFRRPPTQARAPIRCAWYQSGEPDGTDPLARCAIQWAFGSGLSRCPRRCPPWERTRHRLARLAIRFSVGCPLIIPMIIQTIGLEPSGAVWTDEASNVSSPDPSGAVQVDANHPTRNRKVEGSNAGSGLRERRGYLVRLAPQVEVTALFSGTKLRRISALLVARRVRTTIRESSWSTTPPEVSSIGAWRA